MSKVSAIIVAAGEGRRFGSLKQEAPLKGKSILDRCLEIFERHSNITEIVLALKDESTKERYLARFPKITAVVQGGAKRQDSVRAGFDMLDPEKSEIVLVHDGVRPLVTRGLIDRVIHAAAQKGAAVPVIPVEDTLKYVEGERILRTISRGGVFCAQTPQGFLYNVLKEALESAARECFYGTDESSLVERMGKKVAAVGGDPRNIKITIPDDLCLAEAFLED